MNHTEISGAYKRLKNGGAELRGLPKTIIVSVFIWSGKVVKSIFRAETSWQKIIDLRFFKPSKYSGSAPEQGRVQDFKWGGALMSWSELEGGGSIL